VNTEREVKMRVLDKKNAKGRENYCQALEERDDIERD
jgi:hypothetical protein